MCNIKPAFVPCLESSAKAIDDFGAATSLDDLYLEMVERNLEQRFSGAYCYPLFKGIQTTLGSTKEVVLDSA